MDYNIIVPTYEGPMDLLLDLIHKNEIDIYDIPIFQITEQFMRYLEQASEINLELTSDFLLMASTLLEIKSKMLIPKVVFQEDEMEIDEEDPRQELVEKILEYQKYKNISELLRQSEEYEKKAYYKMREELIVMQEIDLLGNCDINKLSKTFLNILNRTHSKPMVSISRDTFSIEEGMNHIRHKLLFKGEFLFTQLFCANVTKLEMITYFLALLELIKIGFVQAKQENSGQDILIFQKLVEVNGK